MTQAGLLLANVVEFDQTWGHRNDVEGFYRGLQDGATVAEYFNLAPNVGDSFLGEVAPWKMT